MSRGAHGNTRPLYRARLAAVRAMDDQATEDDWIELSMRWHDGDLADKRYPEYLREMGWFLLVAGDPLVGVSHDTAVSAGHYAGVEVRQRQGGGWAVAGDWSHR